MYIKAYFQDATFNGKKVTMNAVELFDQPLQVWICHVSIDTATAVEFLCNVSLLQHYSSQDGSSHDTEFPGKERREKKGKKTKGKERKGKEKKGME